jgi:hypothetical protein
MLLSHNIEIAMDNCRPLKGNGKCISAANMQQESNLRMRLQ